MTLEGYSLDELKYAVREKEELLRLANIPKMIDNPDFTDLISMCEAYIEGLSENGIETEESGYFMELLLETLYGDNVYDWINKAIEEGEDDDWIFS